MQVSVVIPARNRASFIERAVVSALRQSLRPAEVIVVDDASDDDTAARAEAAGARVIRRPSAGGAGPARNTGVDSATSEWVAFLDSDDWWLPDHLESLEAVTEGQILVTAPAQSADGLLMGNTTGKQVELGPVSVLVPTNVVITSGTAVRREVFLHLGGFQHYDHAEDLHLWLRVLEHGPGRATSRPTVSYTHHDGQVTADARAVRRGFDEVMSDLADRPWLTRRVRSAAYGRVRWDELRAAEREHAWWTAAKAVGWMASHPAAVSAIRSLLRQRRDIRRQLVNLRPDTAGNQVV